MQLGLFEKNQQIKVFHPDKLHLVVDRSAFIETHQWQEFHENGQIWIDGEIAIIPERFKHLYDYRLGFKGFEGKPVCRIGKWVKYYNNGQLAWVLDYGNGAHDYNCKERFPSYREDGTIIIY